VNKHYLKKEEFRLLYGDDEQKKFTVDVWREKKGSLVGTKPENL